MGVGKELRDKWGFGKYVRGNICTLSPGFEPVPFRGWVDDGEGDLPFFSEMESSLCDGPASTWNVIAPPGFGKTCLARWAAARWGQRFLEDPDRQPIPLWGQILPSKKAFLLNLGQPSLGRAVQKHMGVHPFICIADEGTPHAQSVGASACPITPVTRILFLGSRKAVNGHTVHLAPWELESAFMAAKRILGTRGVERIAAVQSSPAAKLLGFPLFVAKWLELSTIPIDELERRGGVEDILRKLHDERCRMPTGFTSWCEALLGGTCNDLGPLRGATSCFQIQWGATLRAYLLRILLVAGQAETFLSSNFVEKDQLSLLSQIVDSNEAAESFKACGDLQPIKAANYANLHWHLARTPVPQETLQCCRENLLLAGHSFPQGVTGLQLNRSDLSAIQVTQQTMDDCCLGEISLDQSTFDKARILRSTFTRCSLRLTSFRACSFENCALEFLDLAETSLDGSRFAHCVFRMVRFGPFKGGVDLFFVDCPFHDCTLADVGEGSCSLQRCNLQRVDLSGSNLQALQATGSVFSRCDLGAVSAPGVNLESTRFDGCLLSDTDLSGANLRGATFSAVDFQPGPSSRCGHTEPTSRSHPMYGSQSGYYSADLSEGVYGDPDLLRTANLQNCDLRGARFQMTDLFRVDLRGAVMDAEVHALAVQMRAFVD